MRILLAKRRALGDTVFLSGTISALAQVEASLEIHVLVPRAFASLLEGHPHIRSIFQYDTGRFRLLRDVRALRFDHFVQLHSSPSQHWLARLSGARQVHFSVQNNETEKAYGKHPSALEWDGFFLRRIFGERLSVPVPEPKIYLSEQEREEGVRIWRSLGVDPGRVVFLGLGASRPTKRWPTQHFARLAELMRDRADLIPAMITGPGEAEAVFSGQVLDEMRARGLRSMGAGGKGDFLHLAGFGVRKLAQALSAVRAYLGNDSGPKHIAAAVGIPTFTFFGPEDPGEWHPYSRERHPVFFREDLPCRREDQGRWCGLETCDLQGQEFHRCMSELDPIDAWNQLERSLSLRAL